MQSTFNKKQQVTEHDSEMAHATKTCDNSSILAKDDDQSTKFGDSDAVRGPGISQVTMAVK